MVVPSPYALRPPEVIRSYWRLVRAFSATVVSGVPTSLSAMTTTFDDAADAASVRMAVTGGAVLPSAVGSRFEDTTGIRVYETYGMTDQYAGEVPVLFVVPRPGATIDIDALYRHLEEGLHEPPARPRRILVLDALPVTAVGKIFKPDLRDRAMAEKIRLEVRQHCGDTARAEITIGADDQKRPLVDIRLTGATRDAAAALARALDPLPQTCRITTG